MNATLGSSRPSFTDRGVVRAERQRQVRLAFGAGRDRPGPSADHWQLHCAGPGWEPVTASGR